MDALLVENNFTNEYNEEDSEHVESESDTTNGEQLLEVTKQKLFSQNDMGPEINDKLADIIQPTTDGQKNKRKK